jgi:hypothetical protein
MKPKDYECNGIDEIQAAGEERTKHLSLRVYGTINSKYTSSSHDEHRSSGPRPVKLCSDQYIFQFLFR